MRLLHLPRCLRPTILVIALALPVYGAAKAVEIARLQGRWDLVSVNNQPVRVGEPIFFEIDGLTIRGSDGCNDFGGRVDAPSRLVMTQRGCASYAHKLALRPTDLIVQLKAATLVEGRLLVPLPDGGGQAEFKRR